MNTLQICRRKLARTHFQSWLIVGLLTGTANAQQPTAMPAIFAPANSLPEMSLPTLPDLTEPPALPLAPGLSHLSASKQTKSWTAKEHASWILGLRTRSPLAQTAALEIVISVPTTATGKLEVTKVGKGTAERGTTAQVTDQLVVPVQFVSDGLPEVPQHVRGRAPTSTANSATDNFPATNSYGAFAFEAEEPVRAGSGPVLGAPALPVPFEHLADSPNASLLDVDLSGVDPTVAGVPRTTLAKPMAAEESLIEGLDLGVSKKEAPVHRLSDGGSTANKPATITVHESFAPASRAESARLSLSDKPLLESPRVPLLSIDLKAPVDDERPTSEAPFRPRTSARVTKASEDQTSEDHASSLKASVSNSPMNVSSAATLPGSSALPLSILPAPRLDPAELPELPSASFAASLSDKAEMSERASESETSSASGEASASDKPSTAESRLVEGRAKTPANSAPQVTLALSDKESPEPTKATTLAKVEPISLDEVHAAEPPKLADQESSRIGTTGPAPIPQKIIAAEAPPSSQPIVAAQRMKLPEPTLPSIVNRSKATVAPVSANIPSRTQSPLTNAWAEDERSFASLAAQMQQEVKQKFPTSRVKVSSDEEGLVVTGLVNDKTEATKIMAFVRKSSLSPVVDRIQCKH